MGIVDDNIADACRKVVTSFHCQIIDISLIKNTFLPAIRSGIVARHDAERVGAGLVFGIPLPNRKRVVQVE